MLTEFPEVELSTKPEVEKILQNLEHVPGGSETYQRVFNELQDPNGTLEQVGHILAAHPTIIAEILENANLAIAETGRTVTDPPDAAMLLGGDKVLAIVMLVDVFTSCGHLECEGFTAREFFRHSRMVAWYTHAITRRETSKRAILTSSFTAGLLHDIGKLLLAVNFPQKYSNCHSKAKEVEQFGIHHMELGAAFLASRNFPENVVEAVSNHDVIAVKGDSTPSLAESVFIANVREHFRSKSCPSVQKISEQLTAVNDRFGTKRFIDFLLA